MDQGAEQKTLGGADDVGSTVGEDRSHLAEQVEYAGNVADLLTKHVPGAVLDKLAGMMGYTHLGEETAKFQERQSELLESESCSRRETAGLRRWRK